MMGFGSSTYTRNGLACKEKWTTIIGFFLKSNYMANTNHNEDY
jgi:hypothetical protein